MNEWLNNHLKAVCAKITQIRVHKENQNLSLSTSLVLELRNIPFEQQHQLLFYASDHEEQWTQREMGAI